MCVEEAGVDVADASKTVINYLVLPLVRVFFCNLALQIELDSIVRMATT